MDEYLAALLHAFNRDEMRLETEKRAKKRLGWKTALDIVGEWRVARGLR
jgi:hypothetical protein